MKSWISFRTARSTPLANFQTANINYRPRTLSFVGILFTLTHQTAAPCRLISRDALLIEYKLLLFSLLILHLIKELRRYCQGLVTSSMSNMASCSPYLTLYISPARPRYYCSSVIISDTFSPKNITRDSIPNLDVSYRQEYFCLFRLAHWPYSNLVQVKTSLWVLFVSLS